MFAEHLRASQSPAPAALQPMKQASCPCRPCPAHMQGGGYCRHVCCGAPQPAGPGSTLPLPPRHAGADASWQGALPAGSHCSAYSGDGLPCEVTFSCNAQLGCSSGKQQGAAAAALRQAPPRQVHGLTASLALPAISPHPQPDGIARPARRPACATCTATAPTLWSWGRMLHFGCTPPRRWPPPTARQCSPQLPAAAATQCSSRTSRCCGQPAGQPGGVPAPLPLPARPAAVPSLRCGTGARLMCAAACRVCRRSKTGMAAGCCSNIPSIMHCCRQVLIAKNMTMPPDEITVELWMRSTGGAASPAWRSSRGPLATTVHSMCLRK